MKKLLGIVAVLGIVSFAIFRFLYFNDVRVLEEFDFSEGEWKLQKGYYRDSIQYIITDNIEYLRKESIIQSKTKTILLDKFNNKVSFFY